MDRSVPTAVNYGSLPVNDGHSAGVMRDGSADASSTIPAHVSAPSPIGYVAYDVRITS